MQRIQVVCHPEEPMATKDLHWDSSPTAHLWKLCQGRSFTIFFP